MVVLIMGIIASTVVPAMENVREMRAGAARDDIARMLETAKGRALASGEPVGLRIDLNASQLSVVVIDQASDVVGITDPLTGRASDLILPLVYPGVTITGLTNGDGSTGTGVIWFDFEANPHTRSNDGVFGEINDSPAIITLSSAETVVVHAYSGLVEKP